MNIYETIPYSAIVYLIGECNYGGRVTDTWDRRLLCTILDDYINEDIITNSNYKFSQSLDFTMPSPVEIDHNKVNDFIERNLPNFPSPDVYGLHPNAGIQRDLNESNTLLNSILLVSQGTTAASGGDTSSDQALLQMVSDIEKR